MIFQIIVIYLVNFCLISKATDLYWTEESKGPLNFGTTKCQPNEYPFMVFFTDKKCVPSLCSGSLISTEWVLTSKDCIEQQIDINNCLVIAGTIYHSNNLWDEGTLKFLCLLAETHSEGDLGLVKIETVDPFPDHIYLVHYHKDTLPPTYQEEAKYDVESTNELDVNNVLGAAGEEKTTRDGVQDCLVEERGIVLGFHSTPDPLSRDRRNATRYKRQRVVSLRRVVFPLLSSDECEQNISELFPPGDAVVCTVCDFGSSRTCFMDQGGPLLHKGRLLGVVSGPYSKHCFFKHSVAVYTKVSKYERWIDGILRIESNTEPTIIRYERAGLEIHDTLDGIQPSRASLQRPLLQDLFVVIMVKSVTWYWDELT